LPIVAARTGLILFVGIVTHLRSYFWMDTGFRRYCASTLAAREPAAGRRVKTLLPHWD
jgi:hypothetical protein